MESYEVVIVGAGPGGLNCAQKLVEAGKTVLLLEQNNEIGPKVCAGGVTAPTLEYLKISNELLGGKFDEIIICTPRQRQAVKSDKPIVYTIDRKDLGQWQLERLKKTKTVIRIKARVTEIGKDFVIVNGSEKIKFKYLVEADGSSSLVRRFLGIKVRNLIMAIQYIVPTDKYKNLEIFFDINLFNLGYAWIFPHKDYVSIGCGCVASFMPAKKLRENFDRWLKNNKIDVSQGKFEAFPINFDYQGYKFGNIFLIGDAAGLASGLTGGGIVQAMVSGEEIAKLIIDKNYVSQRMKEILKRNERQNRTLRFMAKTKSVAGFELELFLFLTKSDFLNKHLIGRII